MTDVADGADGYYKCVIGPYLGLGRIKRIVERYLCCLGHVLVVSTDSSNGRILVLFVLAIATIYVSGLGRQLPEYDNNKIVGLFVILLIESVWWKEVNVCWDIYVMLLGKILVRDTDQ